MFADPEAIPCCPICLESYTTEAKSLHLPKVLACGHTICKDCCECLSTNSDTRKIRLLFLMILRKDKRPKKISCPMCRKSSPVYSSGEYIGTNFALVELLQNLQQLE